MQAYTSNFAKKPKFVTVDKQFTGVEIYSDANMKDTGFRYKQIANKTKDKIFVYMQSHIVLKNGLIVKPAKNDDNMIVSKNQVAIKVGPGETKGY